MTPPTVEDRIIAWRSLFSAATIRAVINNAPHEAEAILRLKAMGDTNSVTRVRNLVWKGHRWLARNYRNDLVYRTAAIKSLMPIRQKVILPEFRTGQSIVDLMVVSDQPHAIEIKSDLDGSGRLASQLQDYSKRSPLVSLLTTERLAIRVQNMSRFESVGLHYLSSGGAVHKIRVAREDYSQYEPSYLFQSLRRSEAIAVLSSLGYDIPDLPNTRIHSFLAETAKEANRRELSFAISSALARRRPSSGAQLYRLPSPLLPTLLKLNPSKLELSRIQDWLNTEV